jgi:hypothetical protein
MPKPLKRRANLEQTEHEIRVLYRFLGVTDETTEKAIAAVRNRTPVYKSRPPALPPTTGTENRVQGDKRRP